VDALPDQALTELAKAENATLVVVGALGRRPRSQWLLGSVADRTAQTSGVPTLAVRDAKPFVDWLRGERHLRILVAVNASITSDAALRWVARLCQIAPCDVIVGQIAWPPEEHARLGFAGPISLTELDPDIQQVLRRELRSKAHRYLGDNFDIRVRQGFGIPAIHLLQLADDERVDLIVVGSHQRHGLSRLWHGSVSRTVLAQARMNVACVPVAAAASEHLPRPIVANVVAATDLSELGNRAVAHAYALVHDYGTVNLIHVADGHDKVETPDVLSELRKLVPQNADARGIETNVKILPGPDVAQAIYSEAERLGADLICIGTHGRSGLSKAILGSVAQGVLAKGDRPVLVIRAPRAE
jgi:nucleotide-binding universal stress UspA family protein